MASEKQQAKLLLEWAEQNFMEQYIHTATRKGNILDLVFSNSNTLIDNYSTIVNKQFSDHNILKVSLNYQYRNQSKINRKNPYPNSIYEYDLLNASDEDWIRYNVLLSKLSEDFDEKTQNEDTHARLNRFYKVIEEAVTLLFDKKEAFKSDEEKKLKKGNKIPKNVRTLMRKKTSISKKIMQSNSGTKTLKLMNSLEAIEEELEISYKKRKLKNEKVAIGKIKRDPKYFYKYASKFSKTWSRVGPLINKKGETVKDAFQMAEILRLQYESTFSKPDEINSENMGNWFRLFEEEEDGAGEENEEEEEEEE